MSVQPNCFTGLIGLMRTECECLGSAPSGAEDSESGLFLAELEGLNLQQVQAASGHCDEFWEMMVRARDEAEKQADADLLAEVRKMVGDKRKPIRSQIGDDSASRKLVDVPKTYHGMTVQLAHMVGGTATLHRIGGKFDFTGTVDIDVYDRYEDLPIASYTINTVAGKTTWTAITPLELDMDATGSDNARYWFLYTPGGHQPYNVKIHCGCGGTSWKPNWSSTSPYYESSVQRHGWGWAWWAMASGIKGDDLTVREDWSVDNETQGLLLDMQFTCNGLTTLCHDGYDPTDPIQLTRAYARLYLAGYKLLTMVKMSSNPSFWTNLNGEGIEALRKTYFEEYRNRIGWYDNDTRTMHGYLLPALVEDINRYGDCYSCRDPWGMKVSRIRT